MKYINLILLLFLTFSIYGQTEPFSPDTIKIYKNNASINFKYYRYYWFGFPKYSRNIIDHANKFNHQDSIVIIADTPKYFKVYDSKNRLMFEGLNGYWAPLISTWFFLTENLKNQFSIINFWVNNMR